MSKLDPDEDPPRLRDGTPITDEMADEWAREAEAGYDVDELAKMAQPGPGRKSLAGGAGHSPRINLRLAPDLFEKLNSVAAETGRSISDLAREAIERDVRRRARSRR